MKSYNTFAKFYDELTDNVEYEKRSKYIYDFFKENSTNCNSVLDLACGTGSVSEYLADMGMWKLLVWIYLMKCLLKLV